VTDPVLVTGGSGFIGGAILRRLVQDGVEVRALARSDAAETAVRALGAKAVRGDVLDPGALHRCMDGCAAVFHVAGVNAMCRRDPTPMFRANVLGAELVVRAAAAAGVRRVILTSSAATIGEAPGEIGREDSSHRGSFLSRYERSKHMAERRASEAATEVGLELVVTNPASTHGPGRTDGSARLLVAAAQGRLPVAVATVLSLVDIGDCAAGHVLAAERGRPGERYLLCGASLPSFELVDMVASLTGVRRPRRLPRAAVALAGTLGDAAGRVLNRDPIFCSELAKTILNGHRFDGSKAERELGLRYTPIEVTLRRTFEWYREQGLLGPRSHPRPA